MKKAILAFAFILGSTLMVNAQDMSQLNQQVMDHAAEMTAEVQEYLDLSETQVERLRGIHMMYSKTKASYEVSNLSDSEMEEQHASLVERYTDMMRQVLSEEQYASFLENRETHISDSVTN